MCSESIETLQQECCIEMGEGRMSKISTNSRGSKNPTCKKPHPPAKRAECVPESIETLQQECCIEMEGRMSEIFTNRDVLLSRGSKESYLKKPHPPAKRAECVPESIETLQQECCI
ncbi:hypothetical protein TNCT_170271 [Trichonephila clavata]|uniref:Uncharacterized protein n=1 Tax=Trichonephila clavata TaxID=2740835 RepID=A0A8X6IIM0_TRICU|nr:hypothetical protein TNCT_170271 [Trichonephila clavata]